MTLAIIMELLNTITMKTRQNTTPADPNCVNFQQRISQNNTTESAFRWKTHFSQSTQDVKSNKKHITGKVLLVHDGIERSGDKAPKVSGWIRTSFFSFTPLLGKPLPMDHILPAEVILDARESFRPHVPYTPVRIMDFFHDLVNFK
jgi:hypothetical protein